MTVMVFVFFIAYEFLVLKPKQQERLAQAKIEQQQQANAAPEVQNIVENSNSNSVSAPAVVDNKSIIAKITTEKNVIEIDNLGRVAQVTLLEAKYKDENQNQIKLFKADQLRPLELRFQDPALNNEAFKVDMKASSSTIDATNSVQELVLTQTLSNTVLTKKFKFYPDSHYD